jgi:hypothetical protein
MSGPLGRLHTVLSLTELILTTCELKVTIQPGLCCFPAVRR